MDHYVPKRRIPATLWTGDRRDVGGWLFLDLDAPGAQHPTLLDTLNHSTPFIPVVVGEEGRVHLFRRDQLLRVTPGRHVIPSDLYSRGFREWREERADVTLIDGTHMSGRVWMPLERESQRLSDFMNHLGARFFVLITPNGTQFLNSLAVAQVGLDEGAIAPLSADDGTLTAS